MFSNFLYSQFPLFHRISCFCKSKKTYPYFMVPSYPILTFQQWGTITTSNKGYGSPFTITFPKSVLAVIPVHKAGEYAGISLGDKWNNVGFQCWYSMTTNTLNACYIAIGY
nr:MAG TPA: Putative tail fiber protein fold, Tail fiber, receptor [Caudoviricetes sp.]